MKKITHLIFCAVFLATLSSQYGYAALGGGLDSISSDHKALHAKHRAKSANDRYSVEEITADAVTVREYVTLSGVVFAVAWNGYVHPDLLQLLGNYSSEYTESHNKTVKNPGKRQLKITTKNIVVEKWGHMRSLKGRAYAPSLIPDGVRADEIL
jgi:hypothetical protein